jgi:hypothetical protein
MTDVQTLGAPGARETEESSDGLEFADPAYSHSELVPDMLSKRAHDMLDKKALGRYPWIDDEKADDSIYPRITVTCPRLRSAQIKFLHFIFIFIHNKVLSRASGAYFRDERMLEKRLISNRSSSQ